MTVLVTPKALADHKTRDFKMLIDGKWEAGGAQPIERVAVSFADRNQQPRDRSRIWRCLVAV